MASKRQRAFALFGALLFFFSTIAVSAFVIYQMMQDGKNKPASQTQQTNQSENALKGKQLNNFTPVASVPTLQKIDLKVGTGAEAKPGATVTVNYTGAVASTGKIFESSLDTGQPATFGLDQVIKGWTEGIPGMKVGGTRRLVIPASLAYGAQSPSADIPPNSNLVFDVDLISIQ